MLFLFYYFFFIFFLLFRLFFFFFSFLWWFSFSYFFLAIIIFIWSGLFFFLCFICGTFPISGYAFFGILEPNIIFLSYLIEVRLTFGIQIYSFSYLIDFFQKRSFGNVCRQGPSLSIIHWWFDVIFFLKHWCIGHGILSSLIGVVYVRRPVFGNGCPPILVLLHTFLCPFVL